MIQTVTTPHGAIKVILFKLFSIVKEMKMP